MSDLLNAFTTFLAYLGDTGAKDGYFIAQGEYSVPIREETLSEEELLSVVDSVLQHLEHDRPIGKMPEDILTKIQLLCTLVRGANKEEKDELFEYMSQYDFGMY